MVAIPIDRQRIAEFCRRWNVEEFSLFGSVLRVDFRPDSDVDVMVRFSQDAEIGLTEMVSMESELRAMFGREVDLITRDSVEQSQNYIRRKHILEHMEIVHAG
jgi:predicted nucleotidyltransferase